MVYIISKMSLLTAFSRFSLKEIPTAARCIYTSPKLYVQVTPTLYAEPLKKKKKLDPAIIKQREDRRRKKIEKQIRRLEKNARQLKPIDELEVPMHLLDEKELRTRPIVQLSEPEIERRALLQKEWSRYKAKQWTEYLQMLDRLTQAQNKAVAELRKESEELYQAAIEFDMNLLPFEAKGPVYTPPIENYDSPDGEYINVTRKYE